MRAPDDPEVVEWLSRAEEDLRVARVLDREAPDLAAALCFHCQQSGEKLLKALLVAAGAEPPRVHDLVRLLEALDEAGESTDLCAQAAVLNRYAVLPRYPGSTPPAQAEALPALIAVEQIRSTVRARLGLPT